MNRDKQDKAVRTTNSLTHAWEQRNLPRMARALPARVTPDQLTLLGLLAALAIGAGYLLSHRSPLWLLLSVAAFGVHWFADSLDGTLARVRRQERERYGYFVDHTADAISTVVICAGFGLSPFISLPTALLLGISYLLLQMHSEICAYVSNSFRLSFGRFGPTEARIALSAFTLGLVFWQPGQVTLLGLTGTTLDIVALAASGLILVAYLVASAVEAHRLDRLDRLDRHNRLNLKLDRQISAARPAQQ